MSATDLALRDDREEAEEREQSAHKATNAAFESGIDAIERHVQDLAAALVEGFTELGVPVAGGDPGPHLAHIVCVGTLGGGRHYTADDPAINELHERLVAANVEHALRAGTLRFSFAAYNDRRDVERVLDVTTDWISETGGFR